MALPSWTVDSVPVSKAPVAVLLTLPSAIEPALATTLVPVMLVACKAPAAPRVAAPPALTVVAVMPPRLVRVTRPLEVTAPTLMSLAVATAEMFPASDANVKLPESATTDASPAVLARSPRVISPKVLRTRSAVAAVRLAAVPGLVIAPPLNTVIPPPTPVAVKLPPSFVETIPAVLGSTRMVASGSTGAVLPATSTIPRSVTLAVVAVTTLLMSSTESTVLAAAKSTLTPLMVPLATIFPPIGVPLLIVTDNGLPGAMLTMTSVAETRPTSPLAFSMPLLSTTAPSNTIPPRPGAAVVVDSVAPLTLTAVVDARAPV